MKIKVPLKKANRLVNHGPVILVSSFYKGRPNICTVAWNMPVDFDPPKVACVIGDDNYSFECIKNTGEFVINIPGKSLLKKVIQCGSVSGKNIDKFKEFGLTPIAASKVKPPLIKECVAHLECKLLRKDLAVEYNIFLAEILCAWAEKSFFKNNRLLVEKSGAKTIHHLGARFFAFPGNVIEVK
ncbi:MAG: flavin reductase [Candidatus Omnitrophica bacterium CG07_land_8_20_14_0_80_42_15]|uniref:Flavin reductase n=1 Tax=Candidatus Aquitaenariimonas noxiae TaxID=1974741 RepID=A0A2J0KTR2_9BACT|nr:MAG: flavin reductase [Candidatus Omnitrophica bacterium CG07_land_8_20_14_0_80_42_15]